MSKERAQELLALVEDAQRREEDGTPSPPGEDDPRGQLYLKTHGVVRRHLFKKTRSYYPAPNDEDLDDILQDAYSDAFRSLKTFDSTKSGFVTWLCTIALRRSYKWIQKASRNPVVFSIDDQPEDEDVPHREPSTPGHILIEEQQILRETLGFMVTALKDIANPDYRVVVSLVFFGWFTLLELRKVLGFNPNTLKSAYRRGLKEMQGKVAMRCGASYEKLATQIMETHKRGSLAKGMAVLDTDYVEKVPTASSRMLLKLMLEDGRSQGEVCDEEGLTPEAVVEGIKGGVDELLAILEAELT